LTGIEEDDYMAHVDTTLADRMINLLRHLGIERAHFAASMPRDWERLAAAHPDVIASLTLICPMAINVVALQSQSLPLLCVTGDRGRPAKEADRELAQLPSARRLVLRDYFSPPWADVILERRDEIGRAMIEFMARFATPTVAAIGETDGEFDEITYRVRGQGAPLVLMPLALSPSQWEPLIDQLARQFCTISLTGVHLGMVAHLEARAQSSYMRVIDQLLSEIQLRPGHSILEVGCGPGAIVRRLAARTRGANPIVGADVNRYLMREAAALAKREGLERFIEFREADAEKLPFDDNRFDCTICCTVMEEGDANRMLGELVRVTRSGGKVGAVVRSIDLPRWVNLPLNKPLKQKVDDAGFFTGNVNEHGCAEASLYQRMVQAGLTDVVMLPSWASHNAGERLAFLHDRIAGLLDGDELSEWNSATARAKAERTFFIAEPFHCAVGLKPSGVKRKG
jgi:ubiquinone/menaquinone biosynthesis C-methylase UbiE